MLLRTTPNWQKGYSFKKISSLCDPVCLLAPYMAGAEMFLQQIWTCGVDWDDTLCEQNKAKAVNLF